MTGVTKADAGVMVQAYFSFMFLILIFLEESLATHFMPL